MVRAVAFVIRLECDRPDCENLVEVPIEPDETPREVAAAAAGAWFGWATTRFCVVRSILYEPG
jgi:hypothetical protein